MILLKTTQQRRTNNVFSGKTTSFETKHDESIFFHPNPVTQSEVSRFLNKAQLAIHGQINGLANIPHKYMLISPITVQPATVYLHCIEIAWDVGWVAGVSEMMKTSVI